MANKDFPNGLTAVMSRTMGTPRLTKYKATTTSAIFAGGIVTLRAGGQVANLKTTTGAANVLGVAANYVAAGTSPAADVWVYDDPDTIYQIQTDGTTDPGSTTAQAKIGGAAALEGVSGNTTTGRSTSEINYSTISTSTTDPLKIVGYYEVAGNDMTLAHARYLVVLNRNIHMKQSVI